MYSIWKRFCIVAIILLASSAAFGSYFWYRLNVTKDQLVETKVQLDNTLVALDTAKEQLTDITTSWNATKKQLIDTEAQLATTKVELNSTKSQLETAKSNNSQMLNQYNSLKEQVDVRLGLKPQDRQSFITPTNSLVSDKVLETTGGYSGDVNEYWRDFERLYQWVVSNIRYSYDSKIPVLPADIGDIESDLIWRPEYWRMPEETIEDKTGDCEDMAMLLISMLRNYNKGEYPVWMLQVCSGVMCHVGVAFPVEGGNLAILDPAGNFYTSRYGSLGSKSITVAVNDWLYHLKRVMPHPEVEEVLSEDVYEEFSSTAEFIEWAQK